MHRFYNAFYHVVGMQNVIKRSLFRLMNIHEHEGDDNEDSDTPRSPTPGTTDIEINGIPEKRTEDLQFILTRLSRHMFSEVFPSEVEVIYRLRTLKRPRPIIVNMRSPISAHELITAYTMYNERNQHCQLNTRDLGFSVRKIPVLISEHPSNLNKTHRRVVRNKIKKYKNKKRARRTADKACGASIATKEIGIGTADSHGDNHSFTTFTEDNLFESVAGHSSGTYNTDTIPTVSNLNNNNNPEPGASYFTATANTYEDSSDEDTIYSKSFTRKYRDAKERYKCEREERKIALQNQLNMQKLREGSLYKKGPKSLHKKSKPRKQVKSLRDLAMAVINKNLLR